MAQTSGCTGPGPVAPGYQRLRYGGGLVLQGCARRDPTIRRHARAAAPIIGGLLREIMQICPRAGIPSLWIQDGFVPREISPWNMREAFGILRTIHEDWDYEAKHVLWIAELRCQLIFLNWGGRPEEPAPPAEDAEALAGLAA